MLNVRWYLSYKLSYRDLDEMAAERGLKVDHTTIYRWVIKFTPELQKVVRLLKRPAGKSWSLGETYIKVKDQWKYLYRAVDKEQLCTATLGFKSFKSAKITIGGFELMRIIQKRQIRAEGNSSAGIFYLMAA
jgi:transposase-like protein